MYCVLSVIMEHHRGGPGPIGLYSHDKICNVRRELTLKTLN